MFDLERRMQQWRQTLAETLGDRPEVIEELEGHLREEVQRLVQSGQEPELAWETALQRLGEPGRLAEEFAKVPPGPWLPARLAALALAALSAGLACLLLSGLGRGRFEPLLACHIFAVTLGYTATFAVGALAGWSILTRAVAGGDARRAQAFRSAAWKLSAAALGLTAVGVVLGAWWAQDHLGRFWTWDPREFGGLGVLAWDGVLLACLLRRRATLAGMLLGVLGNMVVSLGWFGPMLLVGPVHAYGFSATLAFLLVGFLMTQLVLLCLVFVPARRQAG